MKNLLLQLKVWKDQRGQDLIEYALMAGFVAVAAGAIMPGVATSLSQIFSKVASVLSSANASYLLPLARRRAGDHGRLLSDGIRSPYEGKTHLMKNLLFKLKIWKDQSGQDLIEYALMAGFVAVAAGAIMPGVATSLSQIFSKVASVLSQANAS